jgi:hypothetical protein
MLFLSILFFSKYINLLDFNFLYQYNMPAAMIKLRCLEAYDTEA